MKSPILLRIYRNEKLEGVKQFDLKQIIIGRNKNEGQLELNDPAVAQLHAVIEERDEGYYIADLGSEIGTFKNGQKILDEPLQSGDELKIGPFKMQFFIGVPKPSAPPQKEKVILAPVIPPQELQQPPLLPLQTPMSSDFNKPDAVPNEIEKRVEVEKKEIKQELKNSIPESSPFSQNSVLNQGLHKPIKESVEVQNQPKMTPLKKEPVGLTPTHVKVPKVSSAKGSSETHTSEMGEIVGENKIQKINYKKLKAKGSKTFAPPSAFVDVRDVIKPSKGTVVEVLVTWKERVIAAHHFNQQGVVTIGADPTCDLMVPTLGVGTKYSLIKIRGLATLCLAQDMNGELIKDNVSTKFAELYKQNRMRSVGSSLELDVSQGEMARVLFQGGLISIIVRYVPESPRPFMAPLLDLTVTELTGIILSIVVVAIFQLYMTIYSPVPLTDEARLEEPLRKAIITFDRPKPKTIIMAEEKPPEEKKQPQVVKVEDKPKPQTQLSQKKPGEQGKAAELAPNQIKDKKPKIVSVRPGGAIKTSPKEGSNAPSEKPDPTKTGLLSAFGSKGTQSKLNQTFSGSGTLAGLAEQATGFAGNADNRPGDNLGTQLRDTGAGGKGSATVGISGVTTKSGKGGGTYGYGSGGIGSKGSVNIDVGGQEASFTGSMDKEAIRRLIQQNKNSIRSCYERSLQRKPDLYGKVVIEWDIEEKGRVGRAVVKSNTMGDEEVAQCILGRIKSIQFPDPPPDTTGRVTFPFVFSSQ